eukprot:TRINITY_DN9285_c0_g1_i2.p1 TRINITY_DN9285_c0_g1~~TRINITY_DN9285_c0_g1_i2.p1  ORF type:complete len:226 (-),score=42.03 TRINITY_DN9285_c0_g1_i2:141-776(-)
MEVKQKRQGKLDKGIVFPQPIVRDLDTCFLFSSGAAALAKAQALTQESQFQFGSTAHAADLQADVEARKSVDRRRSRTPPSKHAACDDVKAVGGAPGHGAPRDEAPAAAGAAALPIASAPPRTRAGARGARGRRATGTTQTLELPATISARCEEAGIAESGVSYKTLLEKLLSSEAFANIDPLEALAALQRHGGLLNRTRAELSEKASLAQ